MKSATNITMTEETADQIVAEIAQLNPELGKILSAGIEGRDQKVAEQIGLNLRPEELAVVIEVFEKFHPIGIAEVLEGWAAARGIKTGEA